MAGLVAVGPDDGPGNHGHLAVVGNRSLGGGYFAPQVFLVPGFATVGAVIADRRANTVGWLFVGLGLLAASHALTMAYAERDTLIDPTSLPAGSLVGLLVGWLWLVVAPELLTVLPGLVAVPDGRLPAPRWRPAARFILVAWGASILVNGLAPAEGNPLGCRPWGGRPGNCWFWSSTPPRWLGW
jgi:hypothetical protein